VWSESAPLASALARVMIAFSQPPVPSSLSSCGFPACFYAPAVQQVQQVEGAPPGCDL
jgi:hypothetical protein